MSHADAKTLPAAAATMVVRTPHAAASAPPARAPSGRIPNVRRRMLAFTRPSTFSGVTVCRTLTSCTLINTKL